jgi:phenylpropionate dioxygenase-like ring-hydroxylating dioxygenase large terminal subunit
VPDFVKAGTLSQFQPGAVNECEVSGRRVIVVNLEGTLHAVSNVCPHVSLPLGGGFVANDTIVCPFAAPCSSSRRVSARAVPPPATRSTSTRCGSRARTC